MLTKSTIAVFLMTTVVSARGGIDLTPSVTEYVAEGMKFQQLIFQDEKRRIEYEPPPGWTFHSGANQLSLNPPKKNFAEAVIQSFPLAAPQPLDEKAIKTFEQQFIASLPVGSQFVKIEQEISNSVLLDGNASFEVTVSYQSMGEKFLRSAIFVNLTDTQLMFRFSARKDDFASLHQTFKSSILSWHWTEPIPRHDQIAASAPAQQTAQSR